MPTKYIFITGGVVSGLGKGIVAASVGLLMKSRGFKVVNQKFDPYLNIDPGTMNPYQHGEVFVTEDGAETDLDLGHYERFTDENLTRSNNTTAGRVYLSILNREREGGYNGGTVQVIPNVTDEIRNRMLRTAGESGADVVITEIGGTVGDIESTPFIEAIRQIKYEVGAENCCYIHLTLMPYLEKAGELKSKPAQHSVKDLQGLGIQPNILMCRSEIPVSAEIKEKLSLFCNVPVESVIQNLTVSSIYEAPLMLEREGLGRAVIKALDLEPREPDLKRWREIVDRFEHPEKTVVIAIAGKYVELHDAYLSVAEALVHGGIHNKTRVVIDWLDTEAILSPDDARERLKNADGVVVPGGFGSRGVDGMILITQYARENKIPFLGICLGMQIAAVEFARNALDLKGAHSTEMDPATPYPVIDLMPDQENARMGGTLRLGKYRCALSQDSAARRIYGGESEITERHRHRYEFNNEFRGAFENSKMRVSGVNPERNLVEIVEITDHPWFICVQFHPEFKSRPDRAHPLFRELIAAAADYKNARGSVL